MSPELSWRKRSSSTTISPAVIAQEARTFASIRVTNTSPCGIWTR